MEELKKFEVSKNLITYISPASHEAEAYRALRTNLNYSSVDKKIKSIIVTSPATQDGKSVTSCNLAVSMAETGSRVLLIDADLRKPSIHYQFFIPNRVGLTNLLLEELKPDKVLVEIGGIPNLKVLTAGLIPPNPSEILASNKMKLFINEISKDFDMIILDTPPICYVSDGIILAGIVDGVVLTLASKQTKIADGQNALKALKKVDANILGVVMTKMNLKNDKYYYEY